MKRFLLLTHLLLAAIVTPMLFLLVISGGLYLIGEKGKVEIRNIEVPKAAQLDFKSNNLHQEVEQLLNELSFDHQFEYIRNRGEVIQLRPTSKTYLQFRQTDDGLKLSKHTPDLQSSMIELHKGHGPTLFKTYQKFVALSLLLIVLSGVWMGLVHPKYRRHTTVSLIGGILLFAILALG